MASGADRGRSARSTASPRQEFLAAAHAGEYNFDFLADLDPGQSLEGFLFPDTYTFRRSDTSARDFIEGMLQRFDDKIPPALREEATLGGLTLHEILTIASLVERESSD